MLLLIATFALPAHARPSDGRRRIAKLGPNTARQESLSFIRRRLVLELGDTRIDAHATHVAQQKKLLSPNTSAEQKRQVVNASRERFEKSFSRKLLRHANRPAAELLPKTLPDLPASSDARVTALIKRQGPKRSTPQKVAALEREAARLLGSISPKDQARGTALRSYLTSYKASWSSAWIAQTLGKFQGQPDTVGWKLTDKVTFQNGVTPGQQREIKARLGEAWTIARGVVNPKLLAWLPKVKVKVDGRSKTAFHDGDVISIRPDSSVGDILHELGHHIEDFGGLRTFGAAHAVLTRRAYGSAMEPLSGIDPAGVYGSGELGYRGSFSRPYMGKRYNDGSTELLSTALEEFATPQRAQKLFERDGDHFLQLLKAVQRRPWPQVD